MVQVNVGLMYKTSASLLTYRKADEYIVFHTGSSDTYKLDVFSYSVLEELSSKALDIKGLYFSLDDQFSFEGDKTLEQSVDEKLRDFIRLDLVDIV